LSYWLFPITTGSVHTTSLFILETPLPAPANMSFMFDKMKGAMGSVESSVKGAMGSKKATTHAHTHHTGVCSDDINDHHHLHRFQSFAPQREGNSVKW